MIQNPQLWNLVSEFNLDEPSGEYCFSVRLRAENGWTRNFTDKAILEYKKFIYLAALSDQMVSPSEIIDIVWHQHLIFTKNYEALCNIVGKKIEHIPSTHDPKKESQFKQAAVYTQQLYRTNFGNQPEEIWNSKDPLDSIPLSPAKLTKGKITLVGLLFFIVVFYPVYLFLKPLYAEINNPYFLIFYVLIFFSLFIYLKLQSRYAFKKMIEGLPENSIVNDLSPDEMIYVKNGNIGAVVNTKLDKLIKKKKIFVTAAKTIHPEKNQQPDNIEESAIFDAIEKSGTNHYLLVFRLLVNKPVFKNASLAPEKIIKKINTSSNSMKIYGFHFILWVTFFLLGFCRLIAGIEREKPIAFIIVVLVVFALIVIYSLYQMSELRIKKSLTNHYIKKKVLSPDSAETEDWNYFLLGSIAFSPLLLPFIHQYSTNNSSDSSLGSCGSSCGGSSCGGGGCGGCGGGD